MKYFDLEDLTLFLLRDASEPTMWIDLWAKNYPTIQQLEFSQHENPQIWQTRLQHSLNQISNKNKIMLVAHGVAANAVAWTYYHADILTHKKIVGIILVAPLKNPLLNQNINLNILNINEIFERVRFSCKTAWVSAPDDELCPQDWAKNQSLICNARYFEPPTSYQSQDYKKLAHLNQVFAGWEWGMKLMQEMLL